MIDMLITCLKINKKGDTFFFGSFPTEINQIYLVNPNNFCPAYWVKLHLKNLN